MDFSQVLDLAIQKCEGYYNHEWHKFYHIYPFTTENINGYINYFNLKDRSLLTVGSSCDQVFNAILMDASDITLLDINPFVKYYYYLKMAAILELNMDEYLLFFRYKDYPKVFKDNKYVFKRDIFNKIGSTLRILDYESYLFWDDLFQMFPPIKVRDSLFSNDEYRDSILKECNPYLVNNNTYEELRCKFKKINPNFINCNIDEFNKKDEYDNIWLSNVFTYDYSFDKIKEIINKFDNCLKVNGIIMISYLYDTTVKSEYDKDWSDIYNIDEVMNLFREYYPEIYTFTGVRGILFNDDDYEKDSVLVYKKIPR